MITAEQKLDALRKFRGDIVIDADGGVLLRSFNPNLNEDAYGTTWDAALERLIRLQAKARKAAAASVWFPKPDL